MPYLSLELGVHLLKTTVFQGNELEPLKCRTYMCCDRWPWDSGTPPWPHSFKLCSVEV